MCDFAQIALTACSVHLLCHLFWQASPWPAVDVVNLGLSLREPHMPTFVHKSMYLVTTESRFFYHRVAVARHCGFSSRRLIHLPRYITISLQLTNGNHLIANGGVMQAFKFLSVPRFVSRQARLFCELWEFINASSPQPSARKGTGRHVYQHLQQHAPRQHS